MTLKAVLFDFNGIIINDESIHEQLIKQILIEENLALKPGEYKEICLGRSDRTCVRDILKNRGRVVSEDYLTRLLQKKDTTVRTGIRKTGKTAFISWFRGFDISSAIAQLKVSFSEWRHP